jgi:type IV pilus assembly protein PilC
MSEIQQEDLWRWTRDFCAALDAGGRSFVGCMESATANQTGPAFVAVLSGITAVVAAGYPLSRAMSLHPDVFDSDYRVAVRYGEMHGQLDTVMLRYVNHPEDRAPRCGRAAPRP